jgi:GntR family transcriptional regulator/MocR family aminotransferase
VTAEWTTSAELLLGLDRAAGTPLRAQLESALRAGIRAGRLRPGLRLPSSRALAAELGVARGLVVEAYQQLTAEGYLAARHGSGTVVANAPASRVDTDLPGAGSHGRLPATVPIRYDFRPGVPDLATFPRAAWSRHTRTVLSRLSDVDLGYGDPRGWLPLRTELAAYLARVRGVPADPARVVITAGAAQAFALLIRVLARRGQARIGVEDPCHPGEHEQVAAAGGLLRRIRVDEDGITTDRLSTVDAVLVTPAHQFPTGVVLSARRRAELVAWACRTEGWIIEDDYDAEYRFDREPVGALHGLAPDRVAYCGTASKSLAPALRLGWLVAPPELIDAVVAAKRLADLAAPVLPQAVFAELLSTGGYDRHLRRTRRMYRQRRDVLAAELARHGLELAGIPAGLHAVLRLPAGTDERATTLRAAHRGVGVYPMDGYGWYPEPALVLGFAALSEAELTEAVPLLAAAIGT